MIKIQRAFVEPSIRSFLMQEIRVQTEKSKGRQTIISVINSGIPRLMRRRCVGNMFI